jgi:hypothetical protein
MSEIGFEAESRTLVDCGDIHGACVGTTLQEVLRASESAGELLCPFPKSST